MSYDLFTARRAAISSCGTYRWTLERAWAGGARVCYIGHNPSTADATVDDPTVRAWGDLAKANGFGSFIAVNLYPFRSPDVNACRAWADWEPRSDWTVRDVLQENLAVIIREAHRSARIVACWGALAADSSWTEHVLEELGAHAERPRGIYCLGLTGDGHPKHPMARGRHRIPRDFRFQLWRQGHE